MCGALRADPCLPAAAAAADAAASVSAVVVAGLLEEDGPATELELDDSGVGVLPLMKTLQVSKNQEREETCGKTLSI